MSIFSRKSKTIKNQVDKVIEDSNKQTEKEFGPLRGVIFAITKAVVECREGIKPMIENPDDDKRLITEVYIFNELVLFFMHLTLRQASGLMSQHEMNRLQEYVGPMVADVTIDSYFQHAPQEGKAKLKSEFFHNLNNSEQEYASCSRFDSPSLPEGRSVQIFERLLNLVAERIATLLGKDLNPVAVARIVNVILDAYQNFDPSVPIECFKRDSMDLPPYRVIDNV